MATAVYAASTQPLDPVVTRDVIANNLDHYADSMAQTRWAWAPPTVTYATKTFLSPRTTSVTVDTWYQIAASHAFPIPLRADGSSYKMRVRLGGASSGGHAVKFAIVLAPFFDAQGVLDAANSDSAFVTATTTSATAAWLTGASLGGGAYTTMVALSADEAATYSRLTSTPVDLAGRGASVAQCLVNLVVFGSTANTGSVPYLYGVAAEEFVGS